MMKKLMIVSFLCTAFEMTNLDCCKKEREKGISLTTLVHEIGKNNVVVPEFGKNCVVVSDFEMTTYSDQIV